MGIAKTKASDKTRRHLFLHMETLAVAAEERSICVFSGAAFGRVVKKIIAVAPAALVVRPGSSSIRRQPVRLRSSSVRITPLRSRL